MAYNKVKFGNVVLMDVSGDTIVPEHVLAGDDFHGNDGERATGTMPERGTVSGTIGSRDDSYTIQRGHHSGQGSVSISEVEKQKLVSGNIKKGVRLLGIDGGYEGEPPVLQTVTKTYTPGTSAQSEDVTAGTGYDALAKVTVTVGAIPYSEEPNATGTTVNIG